MIIISVKVAIPLPPLTFVFFLVFIEFATMDIFKGTEFLDSIFDFKKTTAYSDSF